MNIKIPCGHRTSCMVAIPDELLKEASGTLKKAKVYSSILVSDKCCNKTFQLSTTFKDCFVVLGSIFYFGGYFFFKKTLSYCALDL